jgi:hypothetical protein
LVGECWANLRALRSAGDEAADPVEKVSSYSVMFQFVQQFIMADDIKRLGIIHVGDSDGMFVINSQCPIIE